MIFFYIITPIILILFLLSFIIVFKANHPKTQSLDEGLNQELKLETYTQDWLNNTNHQEITIKTGKNIKLTGLWFPFKKNNDKFIIIVHGYECTYYRSLKYVPIFSQLGFDCIVYNQRYHGDSSGTYTSFGYYESQDLMAVTDYVTKLSDNPITSIGTLGSSMGGATVLINTAKDKRISFCISESSFASLKHQLLSQLKKLHLPSFLYYLMNLLNIIIYRYNFSKVSPLVSSTQITVPTMIIHGEKDSFVNIANAEKIYSALKSKKNFYSVKNADHGEAYNQDKVQYEQKIHNFIKENKII